MPPFAGSQGDPTLALRLLYVDALQTMHVVKETAVAASAVASTLLADFTVASDPVLGGDPWAGMPIAVAIAPLGFRPSPTPPLCSLSA